MLSRRKYQDRQSAMTATETVAADRRFLQARTRAAWIASCLLISLVCFSKQAMPCSGRCSTKAFGIRVVFNTLFEDTWRQVLPGKDSGGYCFIKLLVLDNSDSRSSGFGNFESIKYNMSGSCRSISSSSSCRDTMICSASLNFKYRRTPRTSLQRQKGKSWKTLPWPGDSRTAWRSCCNPQSDEHTESELMQARFQVA